MGLGHKRKRNAISETSKGTKSMKSHDNEDQDMLSGNDSNSELEDQDMEAPSSGAEDEDNAWGGIAEQPPSQANGHSGDSHNVKVPPTAQELKSIRDATDLYRSSSFKLQIDALLPNVRPKYTRSTPLDKFLHSLHAFLNTLKSIPAQHPLEASKELLSKGKGVAIPYPLPLPTEDTNWKVSFEKPSEILLAGSWPTKLSVKSKDGERFGVDVGVVMPEDLFQEKDYLNGRVLHKRAYYLAVIASAIKGKKSGLNVDVLYGTAHGDPRLTCLVLRPKADGSQTDFTKLNTEVRIVPILPSSSPIPLTRLSPRRSNIRTSSDPANASDLPTPIYNNSILLNVTAKKHILRLHALKERVQAFSDALALLRVWANQRGYGTGTRMCVRGFEVAGMIWATILDLLISGEEPTKGAFGKGSGTRKPLGKGLSSYQLFRAALDFLARHDWTQSRLFVKSENGHRFSPEEFDSHVAVLVDATSSINVLAQVPSGSLAMLKYDAALTLETLNANSMSQDPFSEVFMKDHRALQTRFDVVMRVDLSSAELRGPSLHTTLDHGSPTTPFSTLSNPLSRLLSATEPRPLLSSTLLTKHGRSPKRTHQISLSSTSDSFLTPKTLSG
ncbi:hypothetical protein QCA50_007271 [Cerrena zonata]|uniref:U3 small nucleolar RNA-associated protein 22 n=1 Tax=Cerrena zonata TaxID=2478898 RepID=A0AAW0GDP5_9APHY